MKPIVCEFEQYTLKAAGTRALAYLTHAAAGAGVVAEGKGDSAEAALDDLMATLKARNASREVDETFSIHVPHPEDYRIALFSIEPSEGVRAMMQLLVNAGADGVSAIQLAEAAGYKGYEAANLHLGQAAAKIADVVGSPRPQSTLRNETTVATCMLATYDDTRNSEEHLLWFVRPNFALAWNNSKQGI